MGRGMSSPDWSDRADRLRDHAAGPAAPHVRDALAGKVDLSGVVQETLLDAHRAGEAVPADDPDAELAWLRRAFANNLTDAVRLATAGRRDATRDVALGAGSGAAGPADLSTPSGRAARGEDLARLRAALGALPDDQRRAVEMRYLAGRSVGEIAAALGRTKGAAAGLLQRGLRALRESLAGMDGGADATRG